MLVKVKVQFILIDYEVQVYKKLQGLRQKDLDVSTYTKEFHRLSLRTKHYEEEPEKVARYLSGLKYSIQDEVNILAPEIVNKCFRLALRAEEKLKRKNDHNNKGRGGRNFRGRGPMNGRG